MAESAAISTATAAAPGKIPLHDAAQNNRPDEIRALLDSRADIQAKDKHFGWSPLHVAAGSGAHLAVETLLECRASLEARAGDGETALHIAAGEGQTSVIRALIEAGALLNCRNNDQETPLHVSVQNAHDKPNLAHVRALVELRGDPMLKDDQGRSAFDHASLYSKNLERAEEVRLALGGAPATKDPDDPWPDLPGELEEGVMPITVAEFLRELGNRRFKEQRFKEAVQYYFKAKRFLPTGPAQYDPIAEGDEEGARARACSIAVNSNAAICKLKLEEYEACANICEGILMVDPTNLKAYFRKGLALRGQNLVNDAETAFRKAAELDPNDVAVQRELGAIAKQRKAERENDKLLAKKMFG